MYERRVSYLDVDPDMEIHFVNKILQLVVKNQYARDMKSLSNAEPMAKIFVECFSLF